MTRIPSSFDRYHTTKIACRHGFIYVRPVAGGSSFNVSATGQHARQVLASDVRDYVTELARTLDESAAQSVVGALLEDGDVDPKEYAMALPPAWIVFFDDDGIRFYLTSKNDSDYDPYIRLAFQFKSRAEAIHAMNRHQKMYPGVVFKVSPLAELP